MERDIYYTFKNLVGNHLENPVLVGLRWKCGGNVTVYLWAGTGCRLFPEMGFDIFDVMSLSVFSVRWKLNAN